MTPSQQNEAIAELAAILKPTSLVHHQAFAEAVWKRRAKVHHILTKYGRMS